MRKYLFFLILLPVFSFTSVSDCGEYRYDFKILIDKEGLLLFNTQPLNSTVKAMVKIPRPEKSEMKNMRADQEKKVVKITAYLIALGKEDDHDYHLVLKSLSGNETLIAEIPDPDCTKLKGFPGLRSKYKSARTFIESAVDASPGDVKPLDAPVKVVVTGAIFFDKVAHGSGHSPNGIEIHPVLGIWKP
jgi:hypothetical protein